MKDKQIEWEWQLSESDQLLEIDVQQMEQVFINVLKNSMEAIESRGKIIIRTSSAPV